jgi:hypothetical protein
MELRVSEGLEALHTVVLTLWKTWSRWLSASSPWSEWAARRKARPWGMT